MLHIGEVFKQARIESNRTIKKMLSDEAINVSSSYYSQIESGSKCPTVEMFFEILPLVKNVEQQKEAVYVYLEQVSGDRDRISKLFSTWDRRH